MVVDHGKYIDEVWTEFSPRTRQLPPAANLLERSSAWPPWSGARSPLAQKGTCKCILALRTAPLSSRLF
jgi:hypothetical protein